MTQTHLRLMRILRPLVRLMISRGIRFPQAEELLKRAYAHQAANAFKVDGKPVTESRVALLSGLQRKSLKALRNTSDQQPPVANPITRIIGLWLGEPDYSDKNGPLALAHRAESGPSFEALTRMVSKDTHPRTSLDEMKRQKLVIEDGNGLLHLSADANISPANGKTLDEYFSSNLGDHAEAAVANLLSAPDPGPFFERAVHFNHLSDASVATLQKQAKDLQSDALKRLNSLAIALQKADSGNPAATLRFRAGAYFFSADEGAPDG